jgi:hypothetical protein
MPIDKVLRLTCEVCGEEEIVEHEDLTDLQDFFIFHDLCLCSNCMTDVFHYINNNYSGIVKEAIGKVKEDG